ncbi:MAG: 50S ribosomal protein L35 [Chitinispirillaceae bacterium]|jgi:large subunit ribosomal protein L35|nr:50S ribosomal protein L35 [Chitinispirillaceae bacterium]
MPKKKTRGSATKRFGLTANGHVKRGKAYRSHILNKKDRKRKRNLRKGTLIHKGYEKKVRSMIEG